MISLNQLVYDIQELIRGNKISDDINIDRRQIIYHINNQRALWIRNEYSKPGKKLDHNLIQDYGAVEIESVDTSPCPDKLSNVTTLKSKKKLPNTLELHNGTAITRIGLVDRQDVQFSLIPEARFPFIGSSKYTGAKNYAYMMDNYLFLVVSPSIATELTHINVRGIAEDPTELSDFIDCSSKPCFTYDDKYPINAWMIPYIKERILAQLGMSLQIPRDNTNDSQENANK